MTVRVLAIGKRHESWVIDGIQRYEKRLRKPFDVRWQFLPHSARAEDAARAEESERILAKLDRDEMVMLLDERGKMFDSPGIARCLQAPLERGQSVTLVIGGAYGVDDRLRQRAEVMWSLSQLVFPHQLVRLIAIEQLYRSQEILAQRSYHHV